MRAMSITPESAMLRAAVLVLFLVSIDCAAQACDLDPLWEDPAVEQAENDLSYAYEVALTRSTQKDLLEKGQRAWDEYRQWNCELMSDRGGAPGDEPLAQCFVFMANERTRELRLLSYQ
jgi:uncharacterized protein YecT (DUF1311 family)